MDTRPLQFSAACSYSKAVCDKSRIVILEVNDRMPVCLGGNHESVHISEVDYVVEGLSEPLLELPKPQITREDKKIDALIMEELEDGSCLQLGIGAIPNSVGAMIAESDLKDLGVHTEIWLNLLSIFMKLAASPEPAKTSIATRWSILLPWVPLACMNSWTTIRHVPSTR